ncbi:hypothetical protein AVEN_104410-1 [Araneus ventricosus]|uniref:Uncharacterized protein n=1 Tax=Araneus ventricosus TaxID=182803 RepID=A0A4Y2N3F2_ARAVE|nr:hypothetical protein AVEN_104410-1 [Araneus ventricosus]
MKRPSYVASENTARWHLPDHIQQIGLFQLDQNLKHLPRQLGTASWIPQQKLELSAATETGTSSIKLPELQKVQVRRSLNIWYLEHHFTWTPTEKHGCHNKLHLCLFN